MSEVLPSWNDGPSRTAILEFVERVTEEGGADYVPPSERIAVFDNDGTLWCEKPMPIELLRHLEANGFTNYIASGGDRDFMRPVTEELYGIPAERVIGSSNALRYLDDEHGGTVSYAAEMDVFDDGPVKPVRIWSRIGQ